MLSLRILFLAVLAVSKEPDENMKPTYTALNLNVTIHWQHPDVDRTASENILYTVIYHRSGYRDDVHVSVSSCVNITRTACCLVEMFPSGTFGPSEYFHVDYLSSTRPMVHGRSETKAFNRYWIDVSAPTIHDIVITSRNVTVWVQGPATPFFKNGRRRLMGEKGLGGKLFSTDLTIYYKSTITDLDDPTKMPPQRKDWTPSVYGEIMIIHKGLEPYTRYRIKIRSKYDESSKDFTTRELHTEQEAPEFGPMIIGTSVQRRGCDVRDIQVSWKESSYQRGSVDIHNYTVTFVGSKSNESTLVVVPGGTFSSVTRNLNRWGEYTLYVTSTNSKGNNIGYGSRVTKDEHDEESYKPTGMEIIRVSPHLWALTWVPSGNHLQCTIGYKVKTSIDGSQEEALIVDGHNASSVTLNFKKIGGYIVDLSPIFKDSFPTKVSVRIDYYVKDWRNSEWPILTLVMILLAVIFVAVLIMSKTVCCDLDTLPDISKSGPMRIAARNERYVPSLKPPPEKEVFDKTRLLTTGIKTPTLEDDICCDDDVFEAKPSNSDSSTPLPVYTYSNNTSELTTAEEPILVSTNDSICPSEDDEPCLTIVPTTEDDIPTVTPLDSYVSAASTNKTMSNVSIYLPNDHTTILKPGTLSTQSSDSGISSTANGGSITDYVPPSPLSDSCHDDFSGYGFETDPPYVASALADRPGRILSTSSEPDDEGMGYRRIDSRRMDDYPSNYLPMIPAFPIRVILANEDPCSDSELKED